MNRRQFLGLCASTAAVGAVSRFGRGWGVSGSTTNPITAGPSIGVELVADGFAQPLAMADPGQGSMRYVADKLGQIRRVEPDGLAEQPVLDLRDRMGELSNWEQGLLGFTLHPDFASNRRCFVRYSAPLRRDMPNEFSHTFVLSEFKMDASLRRADPASERVLLEIPQPGAFHNAGAIAFGPDGHLYVAVGDGGAPEDTPFFGFRDTGPGHATDWYPLNRGGNGQDVQENLLGSILRIDVDRSAGEKPYAIPADNPLVDRAGRDEHYAWGFRNPYRMSFDDDQLIVADVGLETYEEINIVEKGGNYGWNVKEGPSCFNANTAVSGGVADDTPDLVRPAVRTPPLSLLDAISKRFLSLSELPVCPSRTPDGQRLIDPAVVYSHQETTGSAVIGGFVYRGTTLQELQGTYIFGELLARGSGRLYAVELGGGPTTPIRELSIAGKDGGQLGVPVLSFGRDRAGELYVMTTEFTNGDGKVYRLTQP